MEREGRAEGSEGEMMGDWDSGKMGGSIEFGKGKGRRGP